MDVQGKRSEMELYVRERGVMERGGRRRREEGEKERGGGGGGED